MMLEFFYIFKNLIFTAVKFLPNPAFFRNSLFCRSLCFTSVPLIDSLCFSRILPVPFPVNVQSSLRRA